MSANDDLIDTKKWLSRTSKSLEDACSDVDYMTKTQKPVYLAFDPSIIFPPLALRGRLDINNPSDWLDISSAVVFDNLYQYSPAILGYQFVMPGPTFLTIKRNYEIDIDLIDRISKASTDEDMFKLIESKLPGFGTDNEPPSRSEQVDEYLTTFLVTAKKRHERLNKLRDYVRNKIIITDSFLPDDILRQARVRDDEFEELRRRIDQFTTSHDGDRFIRAIEAIGLIGTKQITECFEGRYLFLAWPKSRGYYSEPAKYHRIITSVFYRLTSLMETPSSDNLASSAAAHLYDIRDQVQFYYRKVLQSEKRGAKLTPVVVHGISALRDAYINNLQGKLRIMEDEDRRLLAKSLVGTKREVRHALAEAHKQSQDSRKSLAELAEEFRKDEISSGWDPLPPDNPIRAFLDSVKPTAA